MNEFSYHFFFLHFLLSSLSSLSSLCFLSLLSLLSFLLPTVLILLLVLLYGVPHPTTLNPKATSGHPQNGTRSPLLPSDPENGIVPRRLKSREITSRYMSSSSSSSSASTASSTCLNSKRCPSPVVSRTAAASPTSQTLRRSQSVERRRPVTPRTNSLDLRTGSGAFRGGGMSAAQKLLVTSTRSLSVSFQGESYSLQVSKEKRSPSPAVRKGTLERRKSSTPARPDQSENLRSMEQYRWPTRLRQREEREKKERKQREVREDKRKRRRRKNGN